MTSAPTPDETHREAVRRYQAGDRDAAARLCHAALSVQPGRADCVHLLAVIAADSGQQQAALEGFMHAASLEPGNAVYVCSVGENLLSAGRPLDAIPYLERAASLQPGYERAHYYLGRARHSTGNLDAAEASFLAALRLAPDSANTLNYLGGVMLARTRYADALAYYRRALATREFPEAHYNCASALRAMGDPLAALAHLRHAVRLRPDYARAHMLMGQVMFDAGMLPESIAPFQAALKFPPHVTDAHRELAQALMLTGRLTEAEVHFTEAIRLKPGDTETFAARFRLREALCDWQDRPAQLEQLWAHARTEIDAGGRAPVTPMFAASLPWTAVQKRMIAASHSRWLGRSFPALPTPPLPAPGGRIKLGYLSRDFYDHPVGHQVQGIFEHHDRERFEVHAYSFGPDDRSTYRRRVEHGVERFHDVAGLSIPQTARRIRDDGIHLLVDLMGFSGLGRAGAVAMRPAPVQITWLGFPGTMGADFIDYIVGDPLITPPDRADACSEAIVRLPHTYMPAVSDQPISAAPVRRADHGLPANAVVFCCFNFAFKIEPVIFDVWMRILRRVENSVAWLNVYDAPSQANLRREAEARGVEGRRLVFARRTPSKADHLARHRLADLFLDTHHYNAHVTACDALWAGLPLITCPGDTFASRVAASLVSAAGLPGMVMSDLAHYEALAVRLARSPDELHALREKLAAARPDCPLFDTSRFVRNLERAYVAMWDGCVAGRPPGAIDVVES